LPVLVTLSVASPAEWSFYFRRSMAHVANTTNGGNAHKDMSVSMVTFASSVSGRGRLGFTALDNSGSAPLSTPVTGTSPAGRPQPPALTQNGGKTMTTARDIMTAGTDCVGENDTLVDAARKMRDLNVGSLPICGEDGRLKGMVTDRDIVVKCIADGGDPTSATAASLAEGEVVTIGADDDVHELLRTMKEHKVRRLPVIDGRELVGMVAQADVARSLSDAEIGELVEALSQ
jgi:CBS domain-containing protein